MIQPPPIVAAVLAAGASRRMGRPKALLPAGPGGEPFIARIVRVLREGGIADVLVVGRSDDVELRAVVAELEPAAAYVVNETPQLGQLSSVHAGLREASARGAEALLVLPVDIPLVQPATVARIVSAWHETRLAVVRPVHQGRHGHPVLFGRRVFDELRTADPETGARAVVWADRGRVLDLEVDDPGVLRDVDSPGDYAELFGR